jgi:hypothetical protein
MPNVAAVADAHHPDAEEYTAVNGGCTVLYQDHSSEARAAVPAPTDRLVPTRLITNAGRQLVLVGVVKPRREYDPAPTDGERQRAREEAAQQAEDMAYCMLRGAA